MAETLLKVEGLQAWYGESHILHGVGFEIGRGELVTLLGPQRRGQDDDAEVGHGHRREAHRLGDLRRQADRRPAVRRDRAPGARLLPGGARHLLEPQRRGEPAAAADGAAGRHEPRRDLPALPQPAGAPAQPGHQAVGRRAADAGDRPHPAHRRQPAAARRADRRAWRRSSSSASARSSASSRAAASPSCWSSRTSISPPPSPTAITSWRTATSSTS